jgi:hypothetical protein
MAATFAVSSELPNLQLSDDPDANVLLWSTFTTKPTDGLITPKYANIARSTNYDKHE